MSAELLEVGPGAGQIEPSATGAHGVQQHTAQQPIWNQSLNIHCCNLLKHHTRKIHKTAVVGGGIGAICDQVMECVCVQLTLVLMCGHLTEGQSALTSTISLTLHFRRQQDGPKICKTQQGRGYAPTCKKQACKLRRSNSYLQNLKLSLTDSLTH